MNNLTIETIYTLTQPLSHIGESESTQSFLNTVRILAGGKVQDVFCYSGNALRGAWRDCGAKYMMDKLGNDFKLPKKAFHMLFTGGSISGEQSADVEAAKQLRTVVPILSVLGCAAGNQILEGKIKQTMAYPVCLETARLIPRDIPEIDYANTEISWRKLTGTIQFSRKDDAKTDIGDRYLASGESAALLTGEVKENKKEGDAPTQMRYEVEYLVPGTQLYHRMTLSNCSEVELGAFVSCLAEWSKEPVLGGMSGRGFGQVNAVFKFSRPGEDREHFLTVSDGQLLMSPLAQSSKEAYDQHLINMYNQYLTDNQSHIVKLLEG
jgi:hypothetical protein